MQVLDDPHDQPLAGQPLEQVEEGREQLHPLDLLARRGAGEQRCERIPLGRQQHVDAGDPHQVAERVGDDAERDLARRHVGGVPGEHQCVAEAPHGLGDEPALADAGLAGDEQAPAGAAAGAHDSPGDPVQLGLAADEAPAHEAMVAGEWPDGHDDFVGTRGRHQTAGRGAGSQRLHPLRRRDGTSVTTGSTG